MLTDKNKDVKRIAYTKAIASGHVRQYDFITPYVKDLATIIDMDAIRISFIGDKKSLSFSHRTPF